MRSTLGFLLYDWLDAEALTQRPRFSEYSRETFESVLDTSERIAREKFSPFNRLADTAEPSFDGIKVTLPDSTRDAVAAYAASGLLAAGHDFEVGGMQLPYLIDMAANSFFAMASVSLSGFGMLTYANANLLMAYGTPRQREAFALPQLQGRYLGTMCLSEPQAGSSLGDILTRAVPDGEDFETDELGARYRITGNKMWISAGEHELGENIIHLVLAKIPDAAGKLPLGVKGISLFAVPRVLLNAPNSTGTQLTYQPNPQRNDVALAGLNHKLGYRGIPNTLLNFGEGKFPVQTAGSAPIAGAVGYRIGAVGGGLAAMFHMMNEARINVGMGATMLGYAGYLAALDYARTRPQGRALTADGKNTATAQVPIIQHADVKRMLLAQKSYCEGGLALGLYCARLVDEKNTAAFVGRADLAADAAMLLSILTPIAKSWPSEWCLEANNLAIQVHGGYGYTRDFPVEQYWRDNRLNMIHEGTHGIQGLDLLGRKVIADGGRGFEALLGRIEMTIKQATSETTFNARATQLSTAVAALRGATTASINSRNGNAGAALANATPYLQAFGHLVVAWTWLDVARTAQKINSADAPLGANFYQGKIAAMHYFFDFELPKIYPWLSVVLHTNTVCSEMPDAAF